MERKSARFIGRDIGKTAEEVYLVLADMGYVEKDPIWGWDFTEEGRKHGRSSNSNYPVPSWDEDVVIEIRKRFGYE